MAPRKPKDEGTTELFDGSKFASPVPTVDGSRADKVKIAFGGSIELDLAIARDLEIANKIKYGQELDIPVSVTVASKRMTESKPDDDGTTKSTFTIGMRVDTLYLDPLARELGIDVEAGAPA